MHSPMNHKFPTKVIMIIYAHGEIYVTVSPNELVVAAMQCAKEKVD